MSERMQSLLSRAAEDQASEQRQIQSLLTEVRGLLARLPDDVAGAATRGTDPALTSHINQLGQQVAYLGARLDAIAGAITSRNQDDPGSLAVVGAVQSATEGLLVRFEALSGQVQELAARPAAASGGQALAEVSGRVGGVERNMAELGAAVAEIHRRVSALDNTVAPISADVRALSERIEARIGSRLDSLDEIAAAVQQPSAAATDGSVTEELAEIRASVEALATRPSLAEDRETVVLAVRQLLGETVSATVGQSERNVREHINAAFGQALPASEGRLRAQMETMIRSATADLDKRIESGVAAAQASGTDGLLEELVRAIDASAEAREQQLRQDIADAMESTRQATEQRVMEHVDEAVYALAEILLRRRKAPERRSAAAPVASAPPAAVVEAAAVP